MEIHILKIYVQLDASENFKNHSAAVVSAGYSSADCASAIRVASNSSDSFDKTQQTL